MAPVLSNVHSLVQTHSGGWFLTCGCVSELLCRWRFPSLGWVLPSPRGRLGVGGRRTREWVRAGWEGK